MQVSNDGTTNIVISLPGPPQQRVPDGPTSNKSKTDTCEKISQVGGVVTGAGSALFIGGLFTDATILGLPEGVTLNAFGGVGMGIGGLIWGVGSACSLIRQM